EHFYRKIGANSGRGAYRLALQSDEMVFKTRKLLGKLFNIEDISRIIFTSNVTEALNLSLKGMLQQGDHVVTSNMEHNAMWRPLKVLEKERGIKISVVPCPGGMAFNLADLEKAITPDTRLVALNHASNVTGTLMPVKEAGKICRRRGVPLLLDTAQTAGVYPIDIKEMNISLLAFTGHKGLLGPTGTGGLYIAPGIELKPLKEGGTGGDSLLEHQPFHLPDRYEAGTLNLSGIAGLHAAVSFLIEEGIEKVRNHEQELTAFALEQLKKVPGLTLYGPQTAEERAAVFSFNLENIAPEDVSYVLDEVYGIMVRSGLHCSPQAHRCLGTVERGAVRVGLGYFNQKQDLERLRAALEEIVREARE
ncbi:MAG: aminotransferase class V-fold PLP-dependent enzyme, partial [Candidatus Contubernalis sp.]|nr:aminotransferase class V-fold PLP-dependent enzyme [Candidatus Contubernalis sp.]